MSNESSFIMIGKKKILVRVEEIEQEKLKFYAENPRVYSQLNPDDTVPSQEEIEEHMTKMEHVKQLKEDIEANGGLIEEIIVRDGDYVVLEGNSRLAAYRLLRETDPIKWAKMRCKILPADVGEDLIFKIIGEFHIKGKKEWDTFEQASYLYRRHKRSKLPVSVIAKELNKSANEVQQMIDTVQMMYDFNEYDNHRYSYYFEYIKNSHIKKYRDTYSELDATIVNQIQTGKIKEAADMRKLGNIAKVSDKQSKKLMEKISSGETTIYQAHEELEESGKLDSCHQKLKKFKEYINTDIFVNNCRSSSEVYRLSRYEIDQIMRRLKRITERWDKDDYK